MCVYVYIDYKQDTVHLIKIYITFRTPLKPYFQTSSKLYNFMQYSRSPTYERVQFREHVHKSNLFVSPTKLA